MGDIMMDFKAVKLKMKNNVLLFIFYIPVAALFFTAGFMLLGKPDIAAEGVKEGLSICFDILIPSLFPIMLFFNIISDTGIFDFAAKKSDRFMQTVFRLPGVALPIIIMSASGGFPLGAILIRRAYENKKITLNQGQRLLMFCVNPGPAFTVSTVGYFVLGSEKAGWLVYITVLISSLTVGILTRFLDDGEGIILKTENKLRENAFGNISSAVETAVNSIISICAWVTVFSCVNMLIDSWGLDNEFIKLLKMALEVTNGAVISGEGYSLSVTAAVISFAGLCVHLQIASGLVCLRLKYLYFLASRMLSAVLSYLIIELIAFVYPQDIQVISSVCKPQTVTFNSSAPVAFCMMLMCGLFILGDNYVINKKHKKYAHISHNETCLY